MNTKFRRYPVTIRLEGPFYVAFLLAIKVVVSYGKAEVEEKHSVVVPERLISLLGYARQENS